MNSGSMSLPLFFETQNLTPGNDRTRVVMGYAGRLLGTVVRGAYAAGAASRLTDDVGIDGERGLGVRLALTCDDKIGVALSASDAAREPVGWLDAAGAKHDVLAEFRDRERLFPKRL